MFRQILHTSNSRSIFLIRLMVGTVFLSEGFQKFLFPGIRGTRRFEKIGLPSPEFFGPLVGSFEILCGILILLGLFSRLAAIPLIIIMLTALFATKTVIFSNEGFWAMMHASRTDWAMLLGSIFLVIKGSGRMSIDWLLLKRKNDFYR